MRGDAGSVGVAVGSAAVRVRLRARPFLVAAQEPVAHVHAREPEHARHGREQLALHVVLDVHAPGTSRDDGERVAISFSNCGLVSFVSDLVTIESSKSTRAWATYRLSRRLSIVHSSLEDSYTTHSQHPTLKSQIAGRRR